MKIQVITLFPELIVAGVSSGVLGQAVNKTGLIQVGTIQPRDFTDDPHRSVDDRPFGGADGMVMRPGVAAAAIAAARSAGPSHVIHVSPRGKVLNDTLVTELAGRPGLTILCGRYAGIDQRVLNQDVDEEISIGDYVLSGGELAALVLIDAVARKIPGVLGHPLSAAKDSHASGLLEGPLFTRPREWRDQRVPEILFSGHHERIHDWERVMAGLVTLLRRPDLLGAVTVQEGHRWYEHWRSLSGDERRICGLEGLTEADFARQGWL